MAEVEFKLHTNSDGKATELRLFKICGSAKQNPHMRAFWGATISFFLAFFGWFCIAPLGIDIATSMGVCENQLYPPAEYPRRLAYLKYKNLNSGKFYCVYGKNDPTTPTDCKDGPAGVNGTSKYNPKALAACMCTAGTQCKKVLDDGGTAGVASTIFVRIILGTILEKAGAVNTQALILLFGAIWLYAATGINAPWNFTLIRFFIGAVGSTFVTCQFWCSLMFAPNIVGTANATAAGWGNLGGGFVQFFMILALFEPIKALGYSADAAWRLSILVPASVFVGCAVCLKLFCWDTPYKRRATVADLGKRKAAGIRDYFNCLKDPRIVLMTFQYGACFGCELAMNNTLKTLYQVYFQLSAQNAALISSGHGMLNIFSRSSGGIVSDFLFLRFGMRGRIWAQFIMLFWEAVFLFIFGFMDQEKGWGASLALLLCFSFFVQAACGTTYGIVPFMNKDNLSVVSALVGAGGNIGAVIAGLAFYGPIPDELLPFKVHAGYVMFWALLTPILYWPEYGGMFWAPRKVTTPEKPYVTGECENVEEVEPTPADDTKPTDASV